MCSLQWSYLKATCSTPSSTAAGCSKRKQLCTSGKLFQGLCTATATMCTIEISNRRTFLSHVAGGRVVLGDFGSALHTSAFPPLCSDPCGSVTTTSPEVFALTSSRGAVTAALSPEGQFSAEAFKAAMRGRSAGMSHGKDVTTDDAVGSGVGSGSSRGRAGAEAATPVPSHMYDASQLDSWSLGVLLYIMLAGQPPWAEPSEWDDSFAMLLAGRFQFPAWFPPGAVDLLQSLLRVEPSERLPADEVLEHPFLAAAAHLAPVPKAEAARNGVAREAGTRGCEAGNCG